MISHGLGATPLGDVGVPFLRDSSDGYGYERGFARNPRRSITVGVAEWLFDRMHARFVVDTVLAGFEPGS